MTIQNLSDTPFEDLIECFLCAFENYYVPMPTDPEYYRNRWTAAKVDYTLSFGMFDEGRLVGFIIHAIDERLGHRTAYNTGTGVIPEYRGRGITKRIYQYAIPILMAKGITKCTLEVITKNEKAISAYESAGFKITKNYKCFSGQLTSIDATDCKTEQVAINDIDWSMLPHQDQYSWDFQKETIVGGDYNFYNVYYKEEIESYFVINVDKKMVAQLGILEESEGVWSRLLSSTKQYSSTIRVINVDDRLNAKIQALEVAGLKNTINQYEMEKWI